MSIANRADGPKLQQLVLQYQYVEDLHPLVAELSATYSDFEDALNDTLFHENFLVTRRSQNLADHEITLAQLAFTRLYENERTHSGALALWIEEILGVNIVPVERKPMVLRTAVAAKKFTLDRLDQHQKLQPSGGPSVQDPHLKSTTKLGDSANNQATASESSTLCDGSSQDQGRHIEIWNAESSGIELKMDQKLRRLCDLYSQARAEFDSAPRKSLLLTENAKFLRDTIENCMTYVKRKTLGTSDQNDLHQPVDMAEMRKVLKLATAIAERGCGGKKRPFDDEEAYLPQEPAKRVKPIGRRNFHSEWKPVAIHQRSEAPQAGTGEPEIASQAAFRHLHRPYARRNCENRGKRYPTKDKSSESHQALPLDPMNEQRTQRKPLTQTNANLRLPASSPASVTMLHELLLSLSGHPSPLLSTHPSDSNEALKDLLSPAEHALLRTLSQELGERHKSIRDAAKEVSSSHPSVVCRAVSTAITSIHLAAFQRKILEVEKDILQGDSRFVGAYNAVPLSALVSAFDGWGRRLQWLEEVIHFIQRPTGQAVDSKSSLDCTAAEIIKRLRDATLTGYPDIESMALSLVRVAEMAWLKQLSAWALYGRHPGCSDFLVGKRADDGGTLSTYNIYVLKNDLVPYFVTPSTAKSILFIGKSLCHIKEQQPASKSSYKTVSPDSLLPKHLAELAALKSPISAPSLSSAIAAIRLSLSQNALQKLLPVAKVAEILHVLKDFFLLKRGEFAIALITAADDRLSSRHSHVPEKRKGHSGAVSDLASLTIRDGEVHNVLSRTWTALVSLQSLDDEDVDEELDRARELISLSIRSLDSQTTDVLAKDRGSTTASFDDLLLPSPTLLNLKILSPLDLFLTPDDIEAYSKVHAYLLAIRRAHLHLCKLFQLSVLRRHPPSPASSRKTILNHSKVVQRNKAVRPFWAVVGSAIFFFAELGEYLQGEVVQSSWSAFESWLSPPSRPSSSSQAMNNASLLVSLNPGHSNHLTNSRPLSSRGNDAFSSSDAPHDPETLSQCHRTYLSSLNHHLLLDDADFTGLLRRHMTAIDHLCGLMNRLASSQANLNTGVEDTQTQLETEEQKVLAELKILRIRVEEGGKGLVRRLREIDGARAGGRGQATALGNEAIEGGFVPWSTNGLERLLLKFDFAEGEERMLR
ncbi:uncharacterized protein KY384_007555 [Bacidia gigantensis]|uniref:uncharacterized protein n=1 Tax=Bacidia gigantensis TaxID=2732470 RepID=UPI001D03CE84|nr:uncharacterized protein KY384_007555 [Bacidia gigantensis]KAG8527403.1 hypothetical protein KY384_007555 [Bacidia gigantensis]